MSGIIQATNLQVDNIKHSGGTSSATITSGGELIQNNYMIDMFRLTSDLDADGDLTNWERIDDASSGTIGTGMTVSSGVFTFPRTGLYRVDAMADVYSTNDDLVIRVRLQVTQNNGGSWDEVMRIGAGEDGTENVNNSVAGFSLVNVTDTSNVKVKLDLSSLSTGGAIEGASNVTRTGVMFERKGASQ